MYRFLLTTTIAVLALTIAAVGDNSSHATDFNSVIKGCFHHSDVPSSELCHASVDVPVTVRVDVPPPEADASQLQEKAAAGNCTNNISTIASTTSKPIETEPIEHVREEDDSKKSIATFDEWAKEKLKQEQRKVVAPPSVAPTAGSVPVPAAAPSPSARNYASRECGAKILQSNPEAENTKSILSEKEKDEYMRNPCGKAENKFVVLELCETIQPRTIELGNFELFSSSPREVRIWAAERFPATEWKLLTEFTAADTRQLQSFSISSAAYAKFIKVELVSHYGNEHYCTLTVLKVLGISMVDEYEIEAEAAVRMVPADPAVSEAVVTGQAQIVPEAPVVDPVLDRIKEAADTVTSNAAPEKNVVPESQKIEAETVAPVSEPESQILPPATEKSAMGNIVEEVVSGRMLKKVIEAVTDKFTRDKMKKKPQYRPFDMSLCRVCPIERSCIVPTHLCWVFVWKPPPKPKSPLPRLHLRQHVPQHLRRRRLAFLQRQTLKRRLLEEEAKRNAVAEDQDVKAPIEAPEPPPPAPSDQQQPSTAPSEAPTVQPQPVVISQPQNPSSTTPTVQEAPETIPAPSVSHKESVFMKLNKRIAALELNMSLSTEYLSELSRQYVAQTDMHKKHLEDARRAAQEASDVEMRLNSTILTTLEHMRQEIDTLTTWFSTIQRMTTELSLKRFTRAYREQQEQEERCVRVDATDLKYFSNFHDSTDGLWTTEQVAYAVIAAQLSTLLLVALLSCYSYYRRTEKLAEGVGKEELEKLVQEKIEKALREMQQNVAAHPTSPPRAGAAVDLQQPSTPGSSPVALQEPKKRRRQKRRGNSLAVPILDDRDTTAPGTSQTETSSEAESSRHGALDMTIMPSTPPPPSPPWIEVVRR